MDGYVVLSKKLTVFDSDIYFYNLIYQSHMGAFENLIYASIDL